MIYTDGIHLVADGIDELHEFASSIGLKREWFQDKKAHPHYDIFGVIKLQALNSGAVVVDSKKIAEISRGLKKQMKNDERRTV